MDRNDNADDGCVFVRVQIPDASAVYVHGSFNHWNSTAASMVRGGDGFWEAKLPPNTILDELCFFVIPSGGSIGHVVEWEHMAGPVEAEVVVP